MHVVILTALFPEARALARAFLLTPVSTPAPGFFARSPKLSIALIGLAGIHLKPPLTQDLENCSPAGIIMAGIGGGLAPHLHVGDVVIQGTTPPLSNPSFQIRSGTIATATGIVSAPVQKKDLHNQTGALAVDMETGVAQNWAHKLGIPFLAVRAISDSEEDYLDPALPSLIDDLGRPRLARSLRHLAASPTKLPALLRLQRDTNVALAHLGTTLTTLLKTSWPH